MPAASDDVERPAEFVSVEGLPSYFRAKRSLGRGGQGQAWITLDTRSDEDLVVKVFRLADAQDWKKFDLFERECKVLRSLSHPFIPRYLEHGGDETTGTFYLAMQWVRGESLQTAIEQGTRFSDTRLHELLDRLLTVLGYLHALNPAVIHRDIKPGNIVLTDDGAWLVDFGSVRAALGDTRKSTMVGSYGYMAPEQLRGEASSASDLYALAATIAAVATGQDASSLPSNGLEIDLEACMKPSRLRDVLTQMLAADPRERLQNVAEVRSALRDDDRDDVQTRAVDVRRASIPQDWPEEVARLAKMDKRESAIRLYRDATGASYSAAIEGTNAISKRGQEQLQHSRVNALVASAALTSSLLLGGVTWFGLLMVHPFFTLLPIIAFAVWWGYRARDVRR